jgi:hypothetical protein
MSAALLRRSFTITRSPICEAVWSADRMYLSKKNTKKKTADRMYLTWISAIRRPRPAGKLIVFVTTDVDKKKRKKKPVLDIDN